MAHGVDTQAPVQLHQALHGYADGHRLIASSTTLKAREAKVVLTLSDASGPTSTVDGSGYLTGYPLTDAGLYALARTWPASEMPRPGCVWTHTLLIPFSELATISQLSILTRSFRRPVAGQSWEAYGSPILLQPESTSEATSDVFGTSVSILRKILWALYGHPEERVVTSEATSDLRESLSFLLWSQQWPRLRRSFRFCTFACADRSTEGAAFDLQFIPSTASRSRFVGLLDSDREQAEPLLWIDHALEDFAIGTAGILRAFFREIGAELDGGRELFAPLCELHRLMLHLQTDPEAIKAAIAFIDGPLGRVGARAVRAAIAGAIASHVEDMGALQLDFATRHLDLVPDGSREAIISRVGERLWLEDPFRLVELLGSPDGPHRQLAERAIATLPTDRLLDGLRRQPSLINQLISQRPSLLTEPDLWRAGSQFVEPALEAAIRDSGRLLSALDTIIDVSDGRIASRVCRALGSEVVLSALITRMDTRRTEDLSASERDWLSTAVTPNGLGRAFAEGRVREITTLVALARTVGPDDIPNDYGDDPCATALRGASGTLTAPARLYLCSWLLARGFGYRSHNASELIVNSFEDVYVAALESRLPNECWRLVEWRLPNSFLWANWDRGRRLRVGVMKVFIDRDFPPSLFGHLMHDDDLFAGIASEATSLSWGTGYLRRVKRALRDADPDRFAKRIWVLKRLT